MVDADMTDMAELKGLGVIQEANRRFFHPLGLHIVSDEAALIKIATSPAGVVFAPGYMDPCAKRRFEEYASRRLHARKEALGYYIQPVADAPEKRVAVCCECVNVLSYGGSNGIVYTCQKEREAFVSNVPGQFKACSQRNPNGTCPDFEVSVEALAVVKELIQANSFGLNCSRPEVAKDC
jgi:hypothetical protein